MLNGNFIQEFVLIQNLNIRKTERNQSAPNKLLIGLNGKINIVEENGENEEQIKLNQIKIKFEFKIIKDKIMNMMLKTEKKMQNKMEYIQKLFSIVDFADQ
ncbi:Hypothetical_protein [Hexamita inflata]|uniref:Hypothetical_protein n=1 Tax=Hexamita inflata TaxID=28002 RepID=A0AA86NHW3_9EUKA|nr:Hypothetical protein HINF_LOCUS7824 [Hexamita inflata]